MMDGSGVVEEEKTSDNSSDMHIDHVPQPDGQNPVLEGEIVEQIPQQTKEVVQVDVQNIVLQDEKIALQDENIEHNILPCVAKDRGPHRHPELRAGVLLMENQAPRAPTLSLHYASNTIARLCDYKQ